MQELCLVVFMTGCTGFSNYPYDCKWRNDKNAIFVNARLLPPCSNCDDNSNFQNEALENSLNSWYLTKIMDDVASFKIGTKFSFNWTVSLSSDKQCTNSLANTNKIIFSQDDYTSHMSFHNLDVLKNTPFLAEENGFTPYDHKHEMIFQIFDVENVYERKFGSMTWKMSWDYPNIASPEEWHFFFPNEGIVGVFSPNSFNGSYLYINGNFKKI